MTLFCVLSVLGVFFLTAVHWVSSQCGSYPELLEATSHQQYLNPKIVGDSEVDCQWHIVTSRHDYVIRVSVSFYSLLTYNCEEEYVTIRDGVTETSPVLGRMCATGYDHYTSTGRSVRVEYHNTSPHPGLYFSFSYLAVPGTTRHHKHNTELYGVLGGVALLTFACIIGCCYCCRRRRLSRTSSGRAIPGGRHSSVFTLSSLFASLTRDPLGRGSRDPSRAGSRDDSILSNGRLSQDQDRPPNYSDLSFPNGSLTGETDSGLGCEPTLTSRESGSGSLPPSYSQSQLAAAEAAARERGILGESGEDGRRTSADPPVSFYLNPVLGDRVREEGDGQRGGLGGEVNDGQTERRSEGGDGQREGLGGAGDRPHSLRRRSTAESSLTPPPHYDDYVIDVYSSVQNVSQTTRL